MLLKMTQMSPSILIPALRDASAKKKKEKIMSEFERGTFLNLFTIEIIYHLIYLR